MGRATTHMATVKVSRDMVHQALQQTDWTALMTST
jgi:hypothetical protein